MDSLVLQTVIGLLFAFAAFSALVSVLTEAVARYIGLRGEYLLRGIRSLVDGKSDFALKLPDLVRRTSREPEVKPGEPVQPMVTQIVEQPMVSRSADKGAAPANAGNARLSAKDRRSLPSYVSGRSFARALIGVLVPDASGTMTIDEVRAKVDALEAANPLKQPLLSLLAEAGEDLAKFRAGVEEWYDDHMASVSGWYKRHVSWISLALAAIVVVIFNVNAVELTRSLYTDEALRGAVVAQATVNADCPGTPAECLDNIRQDIRDARASGLPIGWGVNATCARPDSSCNWFDRHGLGSVSGVLLTLIGWALMALATLPGARFWFDALSRLGTLRSSGPKPRAS
ncbi:hypothetical protein E1263_05090 [Kribbella antibiotica]|uniref:Uncharacterized protein n=1 Tax=Kribbella antibiotica TaxID=190195 RepID=A0A4R4ZUX7_9ACTN|nr:hypothetical protein [Kribbella antibiotica]TDD61994.1 hypothetical protein E1263_05090 [Kribbella antibiotica]